MAIRGVLIGVFSLGAVGTTLWPQEAAPPSPGAALLDQFRFESKLWPNLHHFLYAFCIRCPQMSINFSFSVAPQASEADDAPEVERLAVAEGLGITAAAAQSRAPSQPIQPATDDPEPIGAMPAMLPA